MENEQPIPRRNKLEIIWPYLISNHEIEIVSTFPSNELLLDRLKSDVTSLKEMLEMETADEYLGMEYCPDTEHTAEKGGGVLYYVVQEVNLNVKPRRNYCTIEEAQQFVDCLVPDLKPDRRGELKWYYDEDKQQYYIRNQNYALNFLERVGRERRVIERAVDDEFLMKSLRLTGGTKQRQIEIEFRRQITISVAFPLETGIKKLPKSQLKYLAK